MADEVVTTSQRPDLEEAAAAAFRQRWPEFIFHDPVPPKYLARVSAYIPHDDVLLLHDGKVAAGGWGVPFAYSGEVDDLPEGYDAALVRAVEDHEASRTATAFSFMAAAVNPEYDKRGLAAEVRAWWAVPWKQDFSPCLLRCVRHGRAATPRWPCRSARHGNATTAPPSTPGSGRISVWEPRS